MVAHDDIRQTLLARADGEAGPVAPADVATHLDRCADCAGYAATLARLDAAVDAARVTPGPDLTREIMLALPDAVPSRAAHHHRQVRWLLGLVGAVQVITAIIAVIDVGGTGAHVSSDLAAFEAALGVGFLAIAVHPRHASGLLPMAALLAALGVVSMISGVAGGTASILGELGHVLEVVGTLALWDLARDEEAHHPAATV